MNYKKRRNKTKLQSGAFSAGMGFVILGLLSLTGLAAMMVGGITPKTEETGDQKVIILTQAPEQEKDNLQLYTFPAITVTATPSPTNPPQTQESGGFNYGEAPGGNSAPAGGGGGNAGSAI